MAMCVCAAAVWTIDCNQCSSPRLFPRLHVPCFHPYFLRLRSLCARPSSCFLLLFPASSSSPRAASDLEQARPQTSGEEELQLQLALAMSREESQKVEVNTQTHTHTHVSGGATDGKEKRKKNPKHSPAFMQQAYLFPVTIAMGEDKQLQPEPHRSENMIMTFSRLTLSSA